MFHMHVDPKANRFTGIGHGGTSAFFPYYSTRYERKLTSAKIRAQNHERKNTSAKSGAQKYKRKIRAQFYEHKTRNSIFWKFLGNYMLGNFLETICWEILGNYMLGNVLETICW